MPPVPDPTPTPTPERAVELARAYTQLDVISMAAGIVIAAAPVESLESLHAEPDHLVSALAATYSAQTFKRVMFLEMKIDALTAQIAILTERLAQSIGQLAIVTYQLQQLRAEQMRMSSTGLLPLRVSPS